MRIILDTNVFISGMFFSGPPYEILKAWRDGLLQIVLSEEIIDEYQRVGDLLAEQFPDVTLGPMMDLLINTADIVQAPALTEAVCDDPDDDKFLACALAAGTRVIVSGDKHLIRVSGYGGVKVMRPREFVDHFFK